ncbi:tetratricopeptide repeat protein [bacterium]|nr:tetratricopeptide repeat protein [bacterium]
MKILKNSIFITIIILLFLGCDTQKDTYIKAFKAWKHKDYEEAVNLYSKIVYKNKRSKYAPMAEYFLGNINRFQFNRYENAVIEYQKAIILAKFKGEYAYLSQKAIADIYKNNFSSYERAIFEYKELLKYPYIKKDKIEILQDIYACYVKVQLYDEAIMDFSYFIDKLHLTKEQKGQVYLMLANLTLLNGQWKRSINWLEKAEKLPSLEFFAKFEIAQIYSEHKSKKKAKELYIFLKEKGYKAEIIKQKLEELK